MINENESLYTKRNFSLILLAGIIATLFHLYYMYRISNDYYHWDNTWLSRFLSVLSFASYAAILWIIMSRIFNHLKAAMLGFGASFIVYLVTTSLTKNLIQSNNQVLILSSFILWMIPGALYVYMMNANLKKALVAGLLIAAVSIYPFSGGISSFLWSLPYIRIHNMTILRILDSVALGLSVMGLLFVKIEILRHAICYAPDKIRDTKLNLSVTYTKSQVALQYFSTRMAVDSLVLGFIYVLFYTSQDGSVQVFSRFIFECLWAVTLILATWLHRKYLCEFLFSYNQFPSWFYWFLCIPFINLLIFAIGLLVINETIDIPQRKENLKDAMTWNSYNTIGNTILVIQGILFLLSLFHPQPLDIGIRLIGIILTFFFVNGRKQAFNVIAGFYVLLIAIMSLPGATFKPDSDTIIVYPWALVSLYMMYAIFYIDRFSPQDEPDAEPGPAEVSPRSEL